MSNPTAIAARLAHKLTDFELTIRHLCPDDYGLITDDWRQLEAIAREAIEHLTQPS